MINIEEKIENKSSIEKRHESSKSRILLIAIVLLAVIGVLAWQVIGNNGIPDPANKNLSRGAAILSCALLVFREGLEAILVLAAITATVNRTREKSLTTGIISGAGLGIIATVITWFIVVAILSAINLPELDIQAATGLLAILVLLVVMNWFFHKVYWTGWISHHTNRGRNLINPRNNNDKTKLLRGLSFLGFTAIYREGFEIVLFLQQLRLEAGNEIVLAGVAIGLILTSIVAAITFMANEKLPFKKMLILTGILLAVVLLVMVGESIQEMQQANWIAATSIGISFPKWIEMWFAVFPNIQGLISQGIALLLVLGSYLWAQYIKKPVRI